MTIETQRKSAGERRLTVLEAATSAFARGGLHGTSTEDIARAAGISQPYLFRLFGTKKALFIATVERCMSETLEALQAMGEAYQAMVIDDRVRLLAQMQAYAACDDDEIRAAMRRGYGQLHLFVETVSGLPPAAVSMWFAKGMLLNVIATMRLDEADEPWARRLIDGCRATEAPC
jgi:AcrR family transcriptional regulator